MPEVIVERWDRSRGEPDEGVLRERLERRGYRVSRYVYPPGTAFPEHTHGVDKIDAVVRGLLSLGIHQGEHVAVLMDTRPSGLALVAALNRLGAVADAAEDSQHEAEGGDDFGAPLGQALVGKEAGDTITCVVRGREEDAEERELALYLRRR